MVAHYYLGANSYYGFRSLYDKFVTEDDTLFIIKGSPGSGKSTFMKKAILALMAFYSLIKMIILALIRYLENS